MKILDPPLICIQKAVQNKNSIGSKQLVRFVVQVGMSFFLNSATLSHIVVEQNICLKDIGHIIIDFVIGYRMLLF